MRVSGMGSTRSDDVSAFPFGAVAMIITSPVLKVDTSPVALTLAVSASLLAQLMDVPGIGLFEASNAVAVNCCDTPRTTVAASGAETT